MIIPELILEWNILLFRIHIDNSEIKLINKIFTICLWNAILEWKIRLYHYSHGGVQSIYTVLAAGKERENIRTSNELSY